MKRETAKVVHSYFDQGALEDYAKDRMFQLNIALETALTWEDVLKFQGQIKEVKLLLKAKEYAEGVLKNG